MNDAESIIRESMGRAKIKSITELTKRVGLPRSTFHYRLNNPDTFTAREIQTLMKLFNWSDNETANFLNRI